MPSFPKLALVYAAATVALLSTLALVAPHRHAPTTLGRATASHTTAR